MRLSVVGGGIAGLAAAWEASGAGADVTVYEASDRLGGKIRTTDVDGRPVDEGPDAFLARVPDALQLCRELGIEGELVAPATGQAFVWSGGALRALPDGLVLGVPTGLAGLVRSGLLSPAGVARAGLDLVLPRTLRPGGPDVSVGRILRARFGDEVADRLVDPLLGGIHAGRIDNLSLAATAPQLDAVARRSRSLLLGLRRAPRPAASGPVFLSLRGGTGVLVDRLVDALIERGVVFKTGTRVDALPDEPVVVAVPAFAAASLLGPGSEELRTIRYSSVTLATFTWPASAFPAPLTGSGFLVPPIDGRRMTAASFGSNKWPHWSAGDTVVLRVSAHGNDVDPADLVAEVREATGVQAEPMSTRVSPWPDAFPQYEPGHLDRIARVEAALAQTHPRVRLAGAALRGVGLPACIASGRAAARAVLATAGHR
ncbi:MAG TPA: protoporphyrinogen oxidase [Acidimicrobiales bacterium]|nr:protoporphyrinogen oxidase [Acidimicrobiales bacterium]